MDATEKENKSCRNFRAGAESGADASNFDHVCQLS